MQWHQGFRDGVDRRAQRRYAPSLTTLNIIPAFAQSTEADSSGGGGGGGASPSLLSLFAGQLSGAKVDIVVAPTFLHIHTAMAGLDASRFQVRMAPARLPTYFPTPRNLSDTRSAFLPPPGRRWRRRTRGWRTSTTPRTTTTPTRARSPGRSARR